MSDRFWYHSIRNRRLPQCHASALLYTNKEKYDTLDVYRPIQPPSTVTISPDTYPLARLARKTTGPLKSSGFPHRPAGIRAIIPALRLASLIKATFMSVSMYPGAMALTLMPLETHSLDKALVNWPMPPLEAA